MVIMALDHVRDFFHAGAMTFQPDDLTKTNTALFLTRWITHFCAPVFMFTTGLGAFLWARKPGLSTTDLTKFLLTRGLWLMVLELTVLRFAYLFSLTSSPWLLTILWAIGGSMMALGLLIHLPGRLLAALSLFVIVAHNTTDGVRAASFGALAPLWNLLHQPGVFRIGESVVFVAYPFVPWIAVMALGYSSGRILHMAPERRQRWLVRSGLAATGLFLILRSLNVYGDPQPWTSTLPDMTTLSFLRTTKYPPSLLFLLMTLGPALLLLAWFDRRTWSPNHPLLTIGRVPLFFFMLHLFVGHLLAFPFALLRYGEASFLLKPLPSVGGGIDTYPAGFGYDLPAVYAVWVLVLALSYPLCRWFAGVKERRREWWIGYL